MNLKITPISFKAGVKRETPEVWVGGKGYGKDVKVGPKAMAKTQWTQHPMELPIIKENLFQKLKRKITNLKIKNFFKFIKR